METRFDIKNKIYIVCKSERTRSGFRHIAEFYSNNSLIDTTKVTYQNRTWEKYEFETVISKLLEKMKKPIKEKQNIMKIVEKQALGQIKDDFKTVAMVSSLGDIFCTTIKEKNDWKLRMIKAGMGEGLMLPNDWEYLDEEEKSMRLDKIIELMNDIGKK